MVMLRGDMLKGLCTMGNPEQRWMAEEVDLEHGRCGDNSRSPEGGTVRMETIFWGKGTHSSVTVGDW